jgi:hypothetical protein
MNRNSESNSGRARSGTARLEEPQPPPFAQNALTVDAADAGLAVDDGVVVLSPDVRVQALNAGLVACPAEQERSFPTQARRRVLMVA